MVERPNKFQELEGLRLEKRHQEILDDFYPGELIDDPRLLPICFDAARGLVKHSNSVYKIRDTFKQLDKIADGYWNNAGYAWMVDKNIDLSISYRRDLSRFMWEIAPLVPSSLRDFRRDSYKMLESAQLIIPENHWLSSLMDVEKLNRKKYKISERVNLDDVVNAFNGVITSPDSNPDANKAVLDWSLETVIVRGPRRRLVSEQIFLAFEKNNHKMSEAEKQGLLFNTIKRIVHELVHKKAIDLKAWTLPPEDRGVIFSRLEEVSDAWIIKKTL